MPIVDTIVDPANAPPPPPRSLRAPSSRIVDPADAPPPPTPLKLASAEIAAHPYYTHDEQRQVLDQYQRQEHAATNYGRTPEQSLAHEANTDDLPLWERTKDVLAAAGTGYLKAVTAPAALAAPRAVSHYQQGLDADAAIPEGGVSGLVNKVGGGAGGAVPYALLGGPVAQGGTRAVAALGALGGAGSARQEVAQAREAGRDVGGGQELVHTIGGAIKGGLEGYGLVRGAGAAGSFAQRVAAGPVSRAALAVGADVATNAAAGAAGQFGSNLLARADGVDPNRPLTQGIGDAAIEGAGAGAVFGPIAAGHAADAATRINDARQATATLRETLGTPAFRLHLDRPVNPDPRIGDAPYAQADTIAQAVTGKPAVWYESATPHAGFVGPDGRLYLDVQYPTDAAHEAFHSLRRGGFADQLDQLAARNPDVVEPAADEYALRAERLGAGDVAARVRQDPETAVDEGVATAAGAAMTGEEWARHVAETNPSRLVQVYEHTLGLLDSVAGTDYQGKRRATRLQRQFLDTLERHLPTAKAKIADDLAREQQLRQGQDDVHAATLDERDRQTRSQAVEQFMDAAGDVEAPPERPTLPPVRDADAERDARLVAEENAAVEAAVKNQPSPITEPITAPAAEPVTPEPPPEPGIDQENAEAERRARQPEPTVDQLRRMPGAQLRTHAERLNVPFDTRSTTIPRIIDAQNRREWVGASDKDLYRAVKERGGRYTTRDAAIDFLARTPEPVPAPPAVERVATESPREVSPREEASDGIPREAKRGTPYKNRPTVQRPEGFNRGELVDRLLAEGRAVAGTEDAARGLLARAREVGRGDPFLFRDELPTEIRRLREDYPETRRLFKVAQNAAEAQNAAGADTFSHMGDDYVTLARMLGGGRVKEALEAARESDDPGVRFMAQVYDNQRPAVRLTGRETGKVIERHPEAHDQVAVAADRLDVGHRFKIEGAPADVTEGPDGERVLRYDGRDYPLDALERIPVDTGSLTKEEQPPERQPAPGDDVPFSVREKDEDADAYVNRGIKMGWFTRGVDGGLPRTRSYLSIGHDSADDAETHGDAHLWGMTKSGLKIVEGADSNLKTHDDYDDVWGGSPSRALSAWGRIDHQKKLISVSLANDHGPSAERLAARLGEQLERKYPGYTAVRSVPADVRLSLRDKSDLFGNPAFDAKPGETEPLFGAPTPTKKPAAASPAKKGADAVDARIARQYDPAATPEMFGAAKPAPETKPGEEQGRLFSLRDKLERVGASAATFGKSFRDYTTIDPLPKLARHGGDEVVDAAAEHANARVSTPYVVKDLIAKVLPDAYDDPAAREKLADVLVKNNVLGGYDAFMDRRDEANDRAGKLDAEAREARDKYRDLERNPPAALLPNDIGRLKRKYLTLYRQARKAAGVASREATSQQAAVDAIESAHDVYGYENDLQAAMKDKPLAEAVGRWKAAAEPLLDSLYNEMKRLDPNLPRESRGRHFGGARINLVTKESAARLAAQLGEDAVAPPQATGSYTNPDVRRDKFDRAAAFTGDYTTDLEANLTDVLGRRMNEVTKLRFYDALKTSGVAVELEGGQDAPAEIGGRKAVRLPIDVPVTDPATGKTRIERRALAVRDDVAREVRTVLDTDMKGSQNPLARALTTVQLFSPIDAVTHGKNILTRVYLSQGDGGRLWDVVKANPAVGIPRTLYKMFKTFRELGTDTPQLRDELARMATSGLIRPDYERHGLLAKIGERTGLDWVKHLSSGDLLHRLDTAARVILNRQYDELVSQGRAQGTDAGRREFVNTVGQYNRRLMGDLMVKARDAGLSPFVVAGRTYNRNARDLVTGKARFDATSTRDARLTQLGMLASLALTGPLLNLITTGNAAGRSGTPLGAIDLGTDNDDGTHNVWDLLQIAGVRRGLRSTGLDAALEGVRNGQDANQIAGRAVTDAAQSGLHPWLGPAVGFANRALTGRSLDMRGRMEAQQIPEGGALQYVENVRAATESQNPIVYALTRPAFQAAGLDQRPVDEDKGVGRQFADALIGAPAVAAGLKPVRPGMDAAETLASERARARFAGGAMTPEDAGAAATRSKLVDALRADPEAGRAAVDAAVESGDLSARQAAQVTQRAGRSPFEQNLRQIDAADAVRVYEKATPEERDQIRDQVVQKVTQSTSLSHKEQDELLARAGIEPPADLQLVRDMEALGAKKHVYDQAKRDVMTQRGDARAAANARMKANRLSEAEAARLSRLTQAKAQAKQLREQGRTELADRLLRQAAAAG